MKLTAFSHPLVNKAYKRLTPLIGSKKTASYFTLTLSLFTLSFFGIFAIRPTLVTAISLVRQVSDLRKLYTDYENKIGNLIRGQAEYEKIRGELPLIDEALPSNSSFATVAKAIEKFASQENFTINQFQIDPVPISNPTPAGKLYDYEFTLAGTGRYSALSSFLNHLINWRRIVNIKSLEFTQAGGTSSAQIKLSLKAAVYYEP